MEINKFTPAQTLILTKPVISSGKELMKYSFLDLIYRGVLKVYKEWRLPHPNDARERLYTFVSRGEHFQAYKSSYHQDPFVDPFKEDDYEYQVRFLVKKVYNEMGSTSSFKSKKVYKQLKNEGYFTTSLGLKYLHLFFLNGQGSKLKRKFKNILEEAEESLPKFVNTKPEDAKKILTNLGSNVLLLKCFNDELIEQLKPLFNELGSKYENPTTSPYVDEEVFEWLFYSFLDTIDGFDSSFESFDSSFDFGNSDFGGSDFGGGDFGGGDFGGGDW